MTDNNAYQKWSVWIDDTNKIVTFHKTENGKLICFSNKESGLKAISELITKGYKVG